MNSSPSKCIALQVSTPGMVSRPRSMVSINAYASCYFANSRLLSWYSLYALSFRHECSRHGYLSHSTISNVVSALVNDLLFFFVVNNLLNTCLVKIRQIGQISVAMLFFGSSNDRQRIELRALY